jgi:hypothetical protein
MLLSLLGYVALGLVLALPLWHLLFWLAARWGMYTPAWHYLRPYVPHAPEVPDVQNLPTQSGNPLAVPQPSTPGPDQK